MSFLLRKRSKSLGASPDDRTPLSAISSKKIPLIGSSGGGEGVSLQRPLSISPVVADFANGMSPLPEDTFFEQYFKKMNYRRCKSGDITFKLFGYEKFRSCGAEYNTGMLTLKMDKFLKCRRYNFNDIARRALHLSSDEFNFKESLNMLMNREMKNITSHDLYILPIDQERWKRTGRGDLPNVSYLIIYWLLCVHKEAVIVDPIHDERDKFVRIINYSAILRSLQDNKSCRVSVPINLGLKCPDDCLDIVFYQRGTGHASPHERKIREVLGDFVSIVSVELTPGKYDNDGRSCYQGLAKSAALILHQFSIIDGYIGYLKMRYLHRIYIVLDEFSAYAGFTAVAGYGWGIQQSIRLLCYRKGTYTVVNPNPHYET